MGICGSIFFCVEDEDVNDKEEEKLNKSIMDDEERWKTLVLVEEEGEDEISLQIQLHKQSVHAKELDIKNISGIEPSSDNTQSKPNLSNFVILKLIGRGSSGKVLLVEQIQTQKLYAMKVVSKDILKQRSQENHIISEKIILQRADNPFIVQLHYAFQTPTKLYMVMEFMIGGELFFHLKKCFRFSEDKIRFYSAELILALKYLHSNGVVYRDLKPENVILDKLGHIKLADFGMSKILKNEDISYTLCGTPEYVAPEILLKQGHTQTVDWYSLGILIYEMLTGAPPFYEEDKRIMIQNRLTKPIVMMPYFSQQAANLLKGLLEKDPKIRLGAMGAEEIMNHPFFTETVWIDMINRNARPPILPKTLSESDLSYFDDVQNYQINSKAFTSQNIQDTPVDHDLFKSYREFSYQEKQQSRKTQLS